MAKLPLKIRIKKLYIGLIKAFGKHPNDPECLDCERYYKDNTCLGDVKICQDRDYYDKKVTGIKFIMRLFAS